MKFTPLIAGLLFGAVFTAGAQSNRLVQATENSGVLTFHSISNATQYRVEWAPEAEGPWTNFTAAAASLDAIPAPQSASVTSTVPVFYRVVAVVTNPPPAPAGD